jgi:hypothetical protein
MPTDLDQQANPNDYYNQEGMGISQSKIKVKKPDEYSRDERRKA